MNFPIDDRTRPAFTRGKALCSLFLFAMVCLVAQPCEPAKGKPIVASLVSPVQSIGAHSFQSFQFRFDVQGQTLRQGSRLAVALRHCSDRFWSPPQTKDPNGPGYVTAKSNRGSTLAVTGWPEDTHPKDTFLALFPWQHLITVSLNTPLVAGDVVYLTYGDTTCGGPGAQVQMFSEDPFCFQILLASGENAPWQLCQRLCIPVVGGVAKRLIAVAPSIVRVGQPFRLMVRAEDEFGNLDQTYKGTVSIVASPERLNCKAPRICQFTEDDKGVKRIDGFCCNAEGPVRFQVSDGKMATTSNPTLVSADLIDGKYDILWADIHGHSQLSDGRGTPEQYYAYARDVAGLDVASLTDHSFMLTDEEWSHIKKVNNVFNSSGTFVTLHGFEWSGYTENGGDHNIYFLNDDAPICRDRSYFDYRNREIYQGPTQGVNHIEDVFIWLQRQGLAKKAIVVPHWGGRAANPAWHNPQFQRLVEVFSEHRRSEDWAASFMKKGYRLGVTGSGDGHYGKPGNGYLAPLREGSKIGMGLTAIYGKRNRRSVFQALYNRRTYATTGDRILIIQAINNQPPGSEVKTTEDSVLRLEAHGTSPIKSIEILRNGSMFRELHPLKLDVSLSERLPVPNEGRTDYYQVRVLQENNEAAITSPTWVAGATPQSALEKAPNARGAGNKGR
ncbi:MAG: hypothetical protein ACP5M0_14715 [Desulfomonilaceae bacterium]